MAQVTEEAAQANDNNKIEVNAPPSSPIWTYVLTTVASNGDPKGRQASLVQHRTKAGDDCLGRAGWSIVHGRSGHIYSESVSSLEVVAMKRRYYYHLEVRGGDIEEEILHLHGDQCSVIPMMLLALMVRMEREWGILLGHVTGFLPRNI